MPMRKKAKGPSKTLLAQRGIEKLISKMRKMHRVGDVRVTVLKHKWPASPKVIVIMGANN